MQIKQDTHHYTQADSILEISKKLSPHIHLKISIDFCTQEFLTYQKEIITDFVALFLDDVATIEYDNDRIKHAFEERLQDLNANLKSFADKMDSVESFAIKWFIQLVIDNILISSMIWDVSLMIFRNNRLYYSLHNTLESEDKIDVFSDFIEWDTEYHDHIVYVGAKITDIIDDDDIAKLEEVLADGNTELLPSVQSLLESRIDGDRLTFIVHYFVRGSIGVALQDKKRFTIPGLDRLKSLQQFRPLIAVNKYYVTVAILSVLILFLLYNVVANLLETQKTDVILTDQWVLVDVTIDDIKREIQLFQSMDPTSDEKSQTYYSIMQKLDGLEERWRWIEDVNQLRTIVQADYNRWFNIIYVSDMITFDDPSSDYRSKIFTFNNAETNALGTLQTIDYQGDIMIWWSTAALLWVVNDNIRGSVIDYGVDAINGCNINLLRNGLYCYTNSAIFNITRAWVENISTADEDGFPMDIDDVIVYGNANMYVFRENFKNAWTWSAFITRYRNTLWSQVQFQEWQNSNVIMEALWDSPIQVIGEWFSDYAIDGSFMGRSRANKWLYQFWREWTSTLLSARQIPLRWWDTITDAYSDNVAVIASLASRYVYLFDRDNQTFTVYSSNPSKANDAFGRDFTLTYLFRFTFDLSNTQIIDVAIPESAANRPELYLLATDGVYRIKLYEFISSLQNNNSLTP